MKVKGISFTKNATIGRVVDNPTITENAAFFKLNANITEQGANNQFTETVQELPFIALDKSKIKAISTYVKKGKQLYIESYYKSWVGDDNALKHAFVITHLQLGPDENYTPATQKPKSGGFPGGFPG